VKNLPDDWVETLGPWLETPEGKATLRESWPKIIDTYFHAFCHPRKK
jgi:hypothetical protein